MLNSPRLIKVWNSGEVHNYTLLVLGKVSNDKLIKNEEWVSGFVFKQCSFICHAWCSICVNTVHSFSVNWIKSTEPLFPMYSSWIAGPYSVYFDEGWYNSRQWIHQSTILAHNQLDAELWGCSRRFISLWLACRLALANFPKFEYPQQVSLYHINY